MKDLDNYKKQAAERAYHKDNVHSLIHSTHTAFIKGYLDAIEQTGVEQLHKILEDQEIEICDRNYFIAELSEGFDSGLHSERKEQLLEEGIKVRETIIKKSTQIAKLREDIKKIQDLCNTYKKWTDAESCIVEIHNDLEQALNQYGRVEKS